jgi:SAM-dependent methyltransferase
MEYIKSFWDIYYSKKNIILDNPSSFAIYIYDKYIRNNTNLYIADLGCGNCRDSVFFAKRGHNIIAIDKSGVLEKSNTNIELIIDDVETIFTRGPFDIIYMRWFLHAIPYSKGEIIFKNSIKSMKVGSLLCIEVR